MSTAFYSNVHSGSSFRLQLDSMQISQQPAGGNVGSGPSPSLEIGPFENQGTAGGVTIGNEANDTIVDGLMPAPPLSLPLVSPSALQLADLTNLTTSLHLPTATVLPDDGANLTTSPLEQPSNLTQLEDLANLTTNLTVISTDADLTNLTDMIDQPSPLDLTSLSDLTTAINLPTLPLFNADTGDAVSPFIPSSHCLCA